MRDQARVVVIGGGVVGASVLYHLAKGGWTDALLLERSELTSGSTWHAAGGCHTINGDPNVAKLQKYTIELYREIEEMSGQATGFHMTGGVLLASTEARFDWLKGIAAKGAYQGIEARVITPEEAHHHFPLMDPSKFVGGLKTEVDGHLDPSGVTWAYAKSARKLGASYEQHCKVEGLTRARGGGWIVHTAKGDVACEHVVNAGGLWAREVGRMVGIELPVLAMEHMYLLTEDMPEVAEINARTGKEVIHAVDFDGELYLRQERGGMLMGTYEKACVPWSERETPWTFGHELLQPDIDRIAPSLEVGFEHFPAFQTAGIKQVINGPFTFAPDGNPLVGPVRGLPGFWSACGVMAGFSQGGGVGPGAGELDDPRRSGLRRLGHGRRALRRLGHDGLHQPQGAGELRPPLLDPLSERGADRRAPPQDHPDLRPPAGPGRADGGFLGPGGAACGSRPTARATCSPGGGRPTSTTSPPRSAPAVRASA